MNDTTLQLPERAVKPRSSGITMVIDGGLPTPTPSSWTREVRVGHRDRDGPYRRQDLKFSSRLELTTTSAAPFSRSAWCRALWPFEYEGRS
jgi:hypothetical protein